MLSSFKSINFTQPLSINLQSVTWDAIKSDVRGDDLKSIFLEKVPCEYFVLQEVMATKNFYDKFRNFLNYFSIDTPSVRSTRDLLIMRILTSLYGEEQADLTFVVFKENRKAMRLNPLSDADLYGSEEVAYPPPSPNIPSFNQNTLSNLSPEQMRSIISIILSGNNAQSHSSSHISDTTNPGPSSYPSSNPVPERTADAESDSATDPNCDSARNRSETRFWLEIALGRLQSYYAK